MGCPPARWAPWALLWGWMRGSPSLRCPGSARTWTPTWRSSRAASWTSRRSRTSLWTPPTAKPGWRGGWAPRPLSKPSVIKLLLPKSKTSQAVTKPQISLSVTADKTYYINNTAVKYEQLESELKKATQNLNEPLIILRFDNKLTVQDLVDVLQIGSNLKIKMVLGTQTINSH